MTLSDVGVPGQQIDVVNGGDVHPDGRLLSVAEIQQAYRDLVHSRNCDVASTLNALATGPDRPATPHTSRAPGYTAPHTFEGTDTASPDMSPPLALDAPHTSPQPHDPHPAVTLPALPTLDQAPDQAGQRRPTDNVAGADAVAHDWLAVVAAHSGAGASCVALALADGFDAAGRACRLIDVAHPARSGLVAAATAELGNDPTGAWRCGSRHLSTLYRRAAVAAPGSWPDAAAEAATVVDLGLLAPANIGRLLDTRPTVIVVCRVTVPGLRAAEQLLAELDGTRVLLATVGPGRWPGEVAASIGDRVRRLRDRRQLVTVPEDRHLQVIGPTNSPLPKSVSAAGRELLGLIDAAHSGSADAPLNPSAQSAPRKRGKTR